MVSGKLYQVVTAIASALGSFSMALLYVWPSYTTPLLMSENSTILTVPLTSTQEPLVSSLPSLGAMVGTAVVGPLIETFGRKLGGTVLCLPFVLCWALTSVSKSATLILVARFLGGIGGGGNLVYAPMFISEVAEDSIRGALASATVVYYGIGAVLSFLLGWFFGYYTIVWINLAFGIMCCALVMCVPESPVFLMKKNREEEARISMGLYRGAAPTSMVVEEELSRIRRQITPALELKPVNEKADEAEKEKLTSDEVVEVTEGKKTSQFKTLFKSPASRRAFLVVITVISMQVAMGIVPVQVYAKQVFKEADPTQADLYSVIFALVMVGGSLVTGAIADKAGRRILLIGSSLLVAICMCTLGILLQTRVAPPWITTVMIMVYCFCFLSGAGSIPYILLAEVFSPEVQAVASTIIIEWVWFLNFLILVVFSWLKSMLGIHGTFYIFAVNATINAVLGFFMVPETKGLSNAQIQEVLVKRRR